jgi:hypothetical protein
MPTVAPSNRLFTLQLKYLFEKENTTMSLVYLSVAT